MYYIVLISFATHICSLLQNKTTCIYIILNFFPQNFIELYIKCPYPYSDIVVTSHVTHVVDE